MHTCVLVTDATRVSEQIYNYKYCLCVITVINKLLYQTLTGNLQNNSTKYLFIQLYLP